MSDNHDQMMYRDPTSKSESWADFQSSNNVNVLCALGSEGQLWCDLSKTAIMVPSLGFPSFPGTSQDLDHQESIGMWLWLTQKFKLLYQSIQQLQAPADNPRHLPLKWCTSVWCSKYHEHRNLEVWTAGSFSNLQQCHSNLIKRIELMSSGLVNELCLWVLTLGFFSLG